MQSKAGLTDPLPVVSVVETAQAGAAEVEGGVEDGVGTMIHRHRTTGTRTLARTRIISARMGELRVGDRAFGQALWVVLLLATPRAIGGIIDNRTTRARVGEVAVEVGIMVKEVPGLLQGLRAIQAQGMRAQALGLHRGGKLE